jgi:hypothetical protein
VAALYSTRLYGNPSLNGTATLPAVPAGVIWIVRDIAFFGFPAAPAGEFVEVVSQGIIFYGQLTPTVGYLHWEGRQVLEEGDELSITTNTDSTVLVSGYVLSAP